MWFTSMKAFSDFSSMEVKSNSDELTMTEKADALDDKATPGEWLTAVQKSQSYSLASNRFSQYKLGEIMVMLELLSAESRDKALQQQEQLGLPFGQCCLRLNLIDAEDLSQALAWQFGLLTPASKAFSYGEDLVVISRPLEAYAEALRSISGRLMTSWRKPGRNVVAITSPGAREGRSHFAANLAVSLDQAGWKALLVDADFRNPRQHINFEIAQHPGLSRLLCGFAPDEVVRRIPYLHRLSLITSGPTPPNPSELLSRGDFAMFLENARNHYDIVLIDTPADNGFSDTELIGSATGNVLIVAHKNYTRERDLRNLAGRFRKNDVHVIGTVLNTF